MKIMTRKIAIDIQLMRVGVVLNSIKMMDERKVTEERKDRETEISGTRTGLYINERGHTFAGKSGCNL